MDKIPKLILPLLMIAAAVFGFKKCAASRPESKTKPVKEVVTSVEIFEISPEVHSPPVETFGTVQPYFESTLTPQISGLIVRVAHEFRVGEIVRKGLPLIDIDDRSYKSLLIQQEANLAKAELAYAEEKTQAEQAREDWLESGRKIEDASEFVLRIPQITSALAEIESMKASVRKAKADLVRTQIFAPFDAIITNRTASLGNLASEQKPIGSLVAIEKAEVHLPLNPDQFFRVDLSRPVDVVLGAPRALDLNGREPSFAPTPALPGAKPPSPLPKSPHPSPKVKHRSPSDSSSMQPLPQQISRHPSKFPNQPSSTTPSSGLSTTKSDFYNSQPNASPLPVATSSSRSRTTNLSPPFALSPVLSPPFSPDKKSPHPVREPSPATPLYHLVRFESGRRQHLDVDDSWGGILHRSHRSQGRFPRL